LGIDHHAPGENVPEAIGDPCVPFRRGAIGDGLARRDHGDSHRLQRTPAPGAQITNQVDDAMSRSPRAV
jgi:hypothetical protein